MESMQGWQNCFYRSCLNLIFYALVQINKQATIKKNFVTIFYQQNWKIVQAIFLDEPSFE